MNFFRNEKGQGMTEYIIIVALIAIAAIAAFTYFGQTVRTQTTAMTESLAGEEDKAKTTSGNLAGIAGDADKEQGEKTLKNYTSKGQ